AAVSSRWCTTGLGLFYFSTPAVSRVDSLSLHDALPISKAGCTDAVAESFRLPQLSVHQKRGAGLALEIGIRKAGCRERGNGRCVDRKSTRLNSSHRTISYAVFCLKKKYITFITANRVLT